MYKHEKSNAIEAIRPMSDHYFVYNVCSLAVNCQNVYVIVDVVVY